MKVLLNSLKELLQNFFQVFFPATKLYEMLERFGWDQTHEPELKKWRKRVLCSISLCRLCELIMDARLPMLREVSKEISYDIICKVTLINISVKTENKNSPQ